MAASYSRSAVNDEVDSLDEDDTKAQIKIVGRIHQKSFKWGGINAADIRLVIADKVLFTEDPNDETLRLIAKILKMDPDSPEYKLTASSASNGIAGVVSTLREMPEALAAIGARPATALTAGTAPADEVPTDDPLQAYNQDGSLAVRGNNPDGTPSYFMFRPSERTSAKLAGFDPIFDPGDRTRIIRWMSDAIPATARTTPPAGTPLAAPDDPLDREVPVVDHKDKAVYDKGVPMMVTIREGAATKGLTAITGADKQIASFKQDKSSIIPGRR